MASNNLYKRSTQTIHRTYQLDRTCWCNTALPSDCISVSGAKHSNGCTKLHSTSTTQITCLLSTHLFTATYIHEYWKNKLYKWHWHLSLKTTKTCAVLSTAVPCQQQQHTSLATCNHDLFNNCITLTIWPHFITRLTSAMDYICTNFGVHS